ncbi:unnamed protein product [Bemisia tabaci]|uniref:Uncharacterized protein n=1 Tax=Bemisia tabaci TaxID=7038 RepID=A0A9P0F5F5_BEMTA|nr:unnamed protein product [Bemisia tabaci]
MDLEQWNYMFRAEHQSCTGNGRSGSGSDPTWTWSSGTTRFDPNIKVIPETEDRVLDQIPHGPGAMELHVSIRTSKFYRKRKIGFWIRFHMDLEQWNYTFRSEISKLYTRTRCDLIGAGYFLFLIRILTVS